MSLLLSQVCSSGQDTKQLSSCNKATFHYSNASPTTWVVFMKSTTVLPGIARQWENSKTKKPGGKLWVTGTTMALNTLRTGDADLRLCITTVQDRWRKSTFLTRAWCPHTIHLTTQYFRVVLRTFLLTNVYRNVTSLPVNGLWYI